MTTQSHEEIKPSEQEKQLNQIFLNWCGRIRVDGSTPDLDFTEVIANSTRHEGLTAEQWHDAYESKNWAESYRVEKKAHEHWKASAQAAEQKLAAAGKSLRLAEE